MGKTRFAPSPTGELHVGNARTALLNALAAASGSGLFLLRIEDTDDERSVEGHIQQLVADLKAMGLKWHEGECAGGSQPPYRQSQRREIYADFVAKLIREQKAYYCFCNPSELRKMRLEQKRAGIPPRYDGRCSATDQEAARARVQAGEAHTVRFRVPAGKKVDYSDLVKGRQRYLSAEIGDFVIARGNGMATFFFANAVDDALMGVTHVLRGDDHLANTPRQLMILEALGLPAPHYGHISTIVGEDGKPLSKRNGSKSVRQLLEEGWLPEAVINYFARLGHYYPQNQLLSMEELARYFSFERLGKAAAKYDSAQLRHWQKLAIEGREDASLWHWIEPFVGDKIPAGRAEEFIRLIRRNILLPIDADNYASIVTADRIEWSPQARRSIEQAGEAYFSAALQAWSESSTVGAIVQCLRRKCFTGKALFMPLRSALTGLTKGAELTGMAAFLTKEQISSRLEKALSLCKDEEV